MCCRLCLQHDILSAELSHLLLVFPGQLHNLDLQCLIIHLEAGGLLGQVGGFWWPQLCCWVHPSVTSSVLKDCCCLNKLSWLGPGWPDPAVGARVRSHETGVECQLSQDTGRSEAGDKLEVRNHKSGARSQAGSVPGVGSRSGLQEA